MAVLPSVEAHCGAATVNRKLSAVTAFYEHQARHGVDVGELLTTWQPPGRRGGWKPFLHHISKGKPQPRRAIGLKAPTKQPRVLTVAEMQAILDACDRLRDRLLFALLHDTGVRIGEALGLAPRGHRRRRARGHGRAAGQRQRGAVQVAPVRTIPVSAGLIRLYADYLHAEYGDLDSDYVFVNLCAEPRGQALTYPAVYDLVRRLRRRTGIDFDPHWCRHTYATGLLRAGCRSRWSPSCSATPPSPPRSTVYGHLTVEDARRALEAAGWFTGERGDPVTLSGITHGERAGWQRRAAAELAGSSTPTADLPLIAWTVGTAGATLVGHVNGLAPATGVRQVFNLWRVALTVTEPSETVCDDGTVFLRTAIDRNRVRLTLTATVFNDCESGGTDARSPR